MKTNTIDLFLSTGIVMRLDKLSDKKLKKLLSIIDLSNAEVFNTQHVFHTFKHQGTRYFLKPSAISHYAIKTEKVRLTNGTY